MLKSLLDHLIRLGGLTVIVPNGRRIAFGDGSVPQVIVRLRGSLAPIKLALRPDLYLGEAYMDGSPRIEQANLWDLLDLIGRIVARRGHPPEGFGARTVKLLARRLHQMNYPRAARRNVAHHYDLPVDVYRSFLDRDMQYSCGYFGDETVSLDDAQVAKKNHIIAKLLLKPGQRVLDIGCGWGGLAISMARSEDVEVVGVTLSRSNSRSRGSGLGWQGLKRASNSNSAIIARSMNGSIESFPSVGMFEHVGVAHYRVFFDRVQTAP